MIVGQVGVGQVGVGQVACQSSGLSVKWLSVKWLSVKWLSFKWPEFVLDYEFCQNSHSLKENFITIWTLWTTISKFEPQMKLKIFLKKFLWGKSSNILVIWKFNGRNLG